MGRRSIRENKNIYQTSREEAGYTRESAAEQLEFISSDRIERIESEKSLPHPDEVLAMSRCYKAPSLCNDYCSQLCPIGQEYVPKVEAKDLSVIVLEMLATLNALKKEKERLIEIAMDEEISSDEIEDFRSIQETLDKMSLAIDSLNLWVDHTIISGKIDKELLK